MFFGIGTLKSLVFAKPMLRAGLSTLLTGGAAASLAARGWLYLPAACSEKGGKANCRLHIAFHGCRQNQDEIGTLFVRHTSCSLLVQENADPDVVSDLNAWFGRLVQENDPHFRHTLEGPDDMPAHIRAALTALMDGCAGTSPLP